MILTPKQMTAAEQYAVACGTSLAKLMDNAGETLARFTAKTARKALMSGEIKNSRVAIFCGQGNNGGDGFVCANILAADGFEVMVLLICGEPKSELAKNAFDKLSDKVKIVTGDFSNALDTCAIVIDAVFGTGFHGELAENVKEIFAKASLRELKIACDMPSGVNCLSGEVSGGTMKFEHTVTFHAEKIGCLLKPAKDYCGCIHTVDIGISKEQQNYAEYEIIKTDSRLPAEVLPERIQTGHKGTFGKLICVCGSDNYPGAAALCTSAAMRTGVGLVELISTPNVIGGMWGISPEIIYTACDFNNPENLAQTIISRLEKAQAAVIGCGIGVNENNFNMISEIIKTVEKPVIIDADGINSLCLNINVLADKKAKLILTPHPAELARLCGVSTYEAVKNRLELAVRLAKKYNVIVAAKGADSFITDGRSVYLVCCGNTALSKGGSGDMLAGITGSFAAQGAELLKCAAAAGIVLGKTAQKLSETRSQRGIIASDILSALPYILQELSV